MERNYWLGLIGRSIVRSFEFFDLSCQLKFKDYCILDCFRADCVHCTQSHISNEPHSQKIKMLKDVLKMLDLNSQIKLFWLK